MKIIFDLDDTLYVSPELRQKREDAILEFLGDKKDEFLELHKSLGTIGSFNKLGIKTEQFHELMNNVPINLEKDEELIRILTDLKKKYILIVLSNSSTLCVKKSLEKLGILEIIDKFYSVEDFSNSKPAEECFCMVDKGDICIGNSFRKDLMIPKQKEATTIFVGGEHPEADFSIKDIYELEKII
jgi:FMN phosphatase YigB (HAD superfamily)